MTREWYSKYCQLAAANVLDKEGKLRFDYNKLRRARDASALHLDEQVPRDVVELFRNVYNTTVKMAGPFNNTNDVAIPKEPNDMEQNVLMQVLLNIHVGYQLMTEDILYTTFSEG